MLIKAISYILLQSAGRKESFSILKEEIAPCTRLQSVIFTRLLAKKLFLWSNTDANVKKYNNTTDKNI